MHPSPRTPLLTLASPPLLPAALVSLLRSASDRSRRNGAAALKSLAKRDPNAAKAMVSAGAVPALVDLLQVRRDAARPARPPGPHTLPLRSRPTAPPSLQASSVAVTSRSRAVLRSLSRHVPEVRQSWQPESGVATN